MKLFSTLLAVFSFCYINAQTLPNYIPSNGLVGWYPFNGNSNDESGNANNSTYSGSGVTNDTDRFNIPNSAYLFDGIAGSYIRIPADNFPTGDRTVSVWFNTPTVSNRPMLLGYGGGGCTGTGTSFLMGLNVSGNGTYETQAHYNSNPFDYTYNVDPVNTWTNWVVTITGSTIEFYIDGVLVSGSGTFTNTTFVTNTDLVFGVMPWCDGIAPYTDPNGGYFTGKLDDIGFWNRALSPSEISNIYNGSNTGINTVNEHKLISIMTNPISHELTLQTGSELFGKTFSIYDMTGRKYTSGIISGSDIILNTGNLADGIYFLKIEGTEITEKFIR